jgi:hypothetical protein
MASLVTHPDTASHRAQVLADAVVSAYLRDISGAATRPTARRSPRATERRAVTAAVARPRPRRQTCARRTTSLPAAASSW